MHILTRLAGYLAVGALAVSCASTTPSQRGTEESVRAEQTVSSTTATTQSSSPAPTSFEATIDNTAVGGVCAQGTNCWQPTQFQAAFVEHESVSLEELTTSDGTVTRAGWPNNKDRVEVLCVDLEGQVHRNAAGEPVDDWYGIRVPADKMNPKAVTDPRLKKAPDGNGNLAFVSAMWVKGMSGKAPAACPDA
jgi:hypothetical protein